MVDALLSVFEVTIPTDMADGASCPGSVHVIDDDNAANVDTVGVDWHDDVVLQPREVRM